MKRLILTSVLVLSIASTGVAQKSNISKARNKALATENPDFAGAKELIESALKDSTTKNLAETFYTAGLIYDKVQENEANKIYAGKTSDDNVRGINAIEALKYYEVAYDKDQQPNAKGQVKPKFTKKIKSSILNFYKSMIIVNYGVNQYQNQNYKDAVTAFEAHTSIPDLAMFSNSTDKNDIIEKDSTFWQIRYFAAISASLNNDNQKAKHIYEEIKDKGYESEKVYQYLYQIYVEEKDTANFVRVLEEGFKAMPNTQFFLGSLINYYTESNQSDKAVAYLNAAIAQDPTNAQYYNVFGSVQEVLKNPEQALIYFDKAIELNPAYAEAYQNKGRIIYNKGVEMEQKASDIKDAKLYEKAKNDYTAVFAESLPYFEKALDLNSNDAEVMRILRTLYYRLKMTDKYDAINARINQ